ncbi:MAG TPA: UDP-N-acetylmuramoyl-L-alanyl-D-glutamate--2,6-diaminopimelate ligase [Bacilli bacterium]
MRLSSIVDNLEFVLLQGNLNRDVASIAFDSREAVKDGLFVAITGFKTDGHNYIEKALELGAGTIVVEKDVVAPDGVTILKFADTRDALAGIAANFYGRPTERLNLIGITGTNGKTSTSYFIRSIFQQAQKSMGMIGTIGTVINQKVVKNSNTTPESLHLQRIFAEMVAAKLDHCVMEVSSHALSLKRVAYCNFNTGIFTNLTPDHLELHHSMEEYFQAKAQLFAMTKDCNIINIDDEYGRRLALAGKNRDAKLITYGVENFADIYAADIHYDADSTAYTAHTPIGSVPIKVNLPGIIYVYNSLAAVACAYSNGIKLADIQAGIGNVQSIQGRHEVIYQDDDYKVIVDFAHTEDGLEKLLTSLRPFTAGRIILVFGVYVAAAGAEGREKRRAMGKVAAKHADIAIVTSDNPKEQDPVMIINEIVEAIEEENGQYKAFIDRREAIRHAIHICRKGDCVLLAGKGHETSQIIGKREIPFNEREIVLECLKAEKQIAI